MKESYESIRLEVIALDNVDILTESNPEGTSTGLPED